jgi:hypothetical protein
VSFAIGRSALKAEPEKKMIRQGTKKMKTMDLLLNRYILSPSAYEKSEEKEGSTKHGRCLIRLGKLV